MLAIEKARYAGLVRQAVLAELTENSLRYHNFRKKDKENKQYLLSSNLKAVNLNNV